MIKFWQKKFLILETFILILYVKNSPASHSCGDVRSHPRMRIGSCLVHAKCVEFKSFGACTE